MAGAIQVAVEAERERRLAAHLASPILQAAVLIVPLAHHEQLKELIDALASAAYKAGYAACQDLTAMALLHGQPEAVDVLRAERISRGKPTADVDKLVEDGKRVFG